MHDCVGRVFSVPPCLRGEKVNSSVVHGHHGDTETRRKRVAGFDAIREGSDGFLDRVRLLLRGRFPRRFRLDPAEELLLR